MAKNCQDSEPETTNEGVGGGGSAVSAEGVNYCDLDIENNVWVEGVVDLSQNKRGICMLNTMSRESIIYVLQRDPKARDDLRKVTSNADLLTLLDQVPLLSSQNYQDIQQSKANRQGLPYYNLFRGQIPVAQSKK